MAYECPITTEPLKDPVRTPSGHVYEREAITRWLRMHSTDPLTRLPLFVTDLKLARDVQRAINRAAANGDNIVDLVSAQGGQGGGPCSPCHDRGGGAGAAAGAGVASTAHAARAGDDVVVVDLT
jgi:hypothetical protein